MSIEKSKLKFLSISVAFGKDHQVGITLNDELVIQTTRVDGDIINFGQCTPQQIKQISENIAMLIPYGKSN